MKTEIKTVVVNGRFAKMAAPGVISTTLNSKGEPVKEFIQDQRPINFNVDRVKELGYEKFKKHYSFVTDNLDKLWKEVTGLEVPKK